MHTLSVWADASKEVRFGTPVLEGTTVSCLNKEIVYSPELGSFRVIADGETLLHASVCFHEINKRTKADHWLVNNVRGIVNWRVVTNRVGNCFQFEAYRKLPECQWKHFRMSFELLSNGLVRVEQQGWPCPREDLYDVRWESFFLDASVAVGANSAVVTNGVLCKTQIGKRWEFPSKYRQKDLSVTLFADDPARTLTILMPDATRCGRNVQYRENGAFSVFMSSPVAKVFYIDIRKGVPKVSGPNVRGGIDFTKQEKLTLPAVGVRNLLPNGSFEMGLSGWFRRPGLTGDYWYPGKWAHTYHALATNEAKFGHQSLCCLADCDPEAGKWDLRRLRNAVHIGSMPMMLDRGTYTVSFWAKAAHTGDCVNVWSPCFSWCDSSSLSSFASRSRRARLHTPVTTDWKRYSFTFEQQKTDVWNLVLNCYNPKCESQVWLDGFQIEEGSSPTDFEPLLAEGELLTHAPDNFMDASEPIAARLRITTRPQAAGQVRVRVKLPEGLVLCDKVYAFHADARGEAFVALNLEGVGNGLFIVRYDFTVQGKSVHQYGRFARVPFQDKRRVRWQTLFSSMYGDESYQNFAPLLFRRQRQCGIGCADDVTQVKTGLDLYRQFGIDPGLVEMGRNYRLPDSARTLAWGIYENDEVHARRYVNPGVTPGTKLLFAFEPGKPIPLDDVTFARFRQAVIARVQRHMDVKWWEFSSEMPYATWSEEADSKKRARIYAQYLKIFVEAVHATNPKALALTQSPCNLSESGIAEICDTLSALADLGAKVDGVSAHPYRYAPEKPDLDTSIKTVMDHLASLGYPASTPFFFGEMMHWGPYELSALGLQSSTWAGPPRTWVNGTLSYDLGITERRSSAWRARSWLVGLKYAPRIACMTSGAYNNWELDVQQTPRLTQLVSATLSEIFGNATFKQDIRFAPFVRCLVFEDELARPVVATWYHKESVDFERELPPEVEMVLPDGLTDVFEISGHALPVAEWGRQQQGRLRFVLSGVPRYWRFKAGMLNQVLASFKDARLVSGLGIVPFRLSAKPVASDKVQVSVENFLSDTLPLTLSLPDGKARALTLPPAGHQAFELPVAPLSVQRSSRIALPIKVKTASGASHDFDLSFTLCLAQRQSVSANAKNSLMWNDQGLYVRLAVTNRVAQFKDGEVRIYLDTQLNARLNEATQRDEDDYCYAVRLCGATSSLRVFRNFGADQQLSVGVTKVKRDNDWCDTSHARFVQTPRGEELEVLLSAEDIMPLRLESGHAFGLGVEWAEASRAIKTNLQALPTVLFVP